MLRLSSNTKYYKEAYNLFRQCSQNHDRQDLANKVFEELISKSSDTSKITGACSHELEQLLPYVTSNSILSSLFNRLTSNDLDQLIRNRSACFVLEKLLYYLPNVLFTESNQIRLAFDRLFQCVYENFNDYVQEIGTSHIIAATISFLHPLIVPNNDNEYEELIDGGHTSKKFYDLPAEWQVNEKLHQLVKLVKKTKNFNELVYTAFLRTCGYLCTELYEKLINRICSKYYLNLDLKHLLDKRSSFLFEVLLEFPSEQRDKIIYPIILNNIDEFYLHPIGNCFFKHLLLTLNSREIIDKIYQLIIKKERFDKLIQQSHIQLLITFIRICERFHCHYEELIHRLKTSIQCEKNNVNNFIPCLLKLRAGNLIRILNWT